MRIRMRYVAVGAAAAGVVATISVHAIIRAIRKHHKRVLNRKMRRIMTDVLAMRGEDFIPGGELGMSLFRSRIDRLDDKQLAALFALVQVGFFVKASGIDPLHPTKEQIKSAVEKYLFEERFAPDSRNKLLGELDTSDSYAALSTAFHILASH